MTGATVCSGIGAPEVAMPFVDWKWCAEIDAFPSAVLAHHHPASMNLGDLAGPDFIERARAFGPLDLLVAGTPCQAFSIAGNRRSLEDERGNLTLRFLEILHAIKPRFVLWENVPGVLSTGDNAFGCFLGGLVGADAALAPTRRRYSECDGFEFDMPVPWTCAGVVDGPFGAAAWRVLDAQYFGLAQRRKRVFVVFRSGADGEHPAEILFEFESMRRNSPPSREAGEETAGTLRGGTEDRGWGYELDGPGAFIPEITMSLNAKGGTGRIDGESETFIAHSLRADGFDASEDGTGRGTPLVAVVPILEAGARTGKSTTDPRAGMGVGEAGDPMFTLQSGKQHAVAFSSKDHGADIGEIAPALRAMGHDKSHANGGGQVAVALAIRGRDGERQMEMGEEIANAIVTPNGGRDGMGVGATMQGMAVRRLTPMECERLQGFPDYYTYVSHRNKRAADGPRYKALGNSMAVPCIAWIAERIRKSVSMWT